MKRILLIADCGDFKDNSNGVYAKNMQLYNRLHELFSAVKHVNTNGWKSNPLVILNVLLSLIRYKNDTIIVSLNTTSAYKLFSIASKLIPGIKFIYFVIGGRLGDYIQNLNKKQRNNYRCVKWFLVESPQMKVQLQNLGYKQVKYLPNFKRITYIPQIQESTSRDVNFVFISRIMPEKGCDLILDAVKYLNSQTDGLNFHVDFYGKIDAAYQHKFTETINHLDNVTYKGYIDLTDPKNYDTLSKYNAMLFPTYWKGEGFPGVLIDAFICGLPVIASDWAYNGEIISHEQTGLIIPTKDMTALADAMNSFICKQDELHRMRRNCQLRAQDYDTRVVLTKDLLISLTSD